MLLDLKYECTNALSSITIASSFLLTYVIYANIKNILLCEETIDVWKGVFCAQCLKSHPDSIVSLTTLY